MGLDTNGIEKIVKTHMEEQPDKVICSECGRDMDYSQEVDKFLDMTLIITPCDCKEQDIERAR